eukprot:scaffold869_cov303-Pinguiococcus_pyrenoidosus.AAC.29
MNLSPSSNSLKFEISRFAGFWSEVVGRLDDADVRVKIVVQSCPVLKRQTNGGDSHLCGVEPVGSRSSAPSCFRRVLERKAAASKNPRTREP